MRRFSSCLFLCTAMSMALTCHAVAAAVKEPAPAEALVANPMTAITTYVQIAYAAYGDAYLTAKKLHETVKEFAASPSEEGLESLRQLWLSTRRPYLMMEGLRFYDGPIDVFPQDTSIEGPESRINSWPIRPQFIDDAKGPAGNSSLIDSKRSLKPDALRDLNQADNERDVATGFHAIEYMLWGASDKNGKPTRTWQDFQGDNPAAKRRLQYLTGATQVLQDDLQYLRAAWTPTDTSTYTRRFILDQKESLSKILTGLATLSGYELPGKHLGIAAPDGKQPEVQSPYSHSSHADLLRTAMGIQAILVGEYGPVKGIGIIALVAQKDAKLAEKLRRANAETIDAIKEIPGPLEDTVVGQNPDKNAQEKARDAAKALVAQGRLLVEAGKAIGVPVDVMGD